MAKARVLPSDLASKQLTICSGSLLTGMSMRIHYVSQIYIFVYLLWFVQAAGAVYRRVVMWRAARVASLPYLY